MTISKATTEFDLRIRAMPDESDPDAIRRLRAWLKSGLRRFGLRCVEVNPRPDPADKEPSQ